MGHQDGKLLEYSEIKAIVEGAFKPLKCGLKDDYEFKVNINLHDGNNCIYRVENVLVDSICKRSELKSFLEQRRTEVRRMGVNLDPWDFPGPN